MAIVGICHGHHPCHGSPIAPQLLQSSISWPQVWPTHVHSYVPYASTTPTDPSHWTDHSPTDCNSPIITMVGPMTPDGCSSAIPNLITDSPPCLSTGQEFCQTDPESHFLIKFCILLVLYTNTFCSSCLLSPNFLSRTKPTQQLRHRLTYL